MPTFVSWASSPIPVETRRKMLGAKRNIKELGVKAPRIPPPISPVTRELLSPGSTLSAIIPPVVAPIPIAVSEPKN